MLFQHAACKTSIALRVRHPALRPYADGRFGREKWTQAKAKASPTRIAGEALLEARGIEPRSRSTSAPTSTCLSSRLLLRPESCDPRGARSPQKFPLGRTLLKLSDCEFDLFRHRRNRLPGFKNKRS